MKKTKPIIILIYIVIVGAVVCLGVELVARVRYQKSYLMAHVSDNPVFHHLPAPHYQGTMTSEGDFSDTFITNNRGMRGPGDYQYEKTPGVRRIALYGDSFLFGVGVQSNETISSRIQDYLKESGNNSWEVYNFGVCSYSPLLEYIYLKNEGLKYNPDLVVLLLDLCDIQDDYLYEPHLIYDQSGEITGCDPLKVNGRTDLWAAAKERSYFLRMLDEKFIQSLRKMRTIGFAKYFSNKMHHVRNKTEILTNPHIDNIEFDRFIFSREDKDEEILRRHFGRTANYLVKIKKLLDEKGIPLVVVVYPYGHEVRGDFWAKGRVYWGFEPGKVYSPMRAFEMVSDFCRGNGIGVISLYQPMIISSNNTLYYNNDGHWTAAGQAAAAKGIFSSKEFQKYINT